MEYWMNRCPIKALEEFLLKYDFVSESEKSNIYECIEEEIEEVLVFAKESPYPDLDENKLTSEVFKGIATNNKEKRAKTRWRRR